MTLRISSALHYHPAHSPCWWKTEELNPTRISAGPDFQDQSPAIPAASSSVLVPQARRELRMFLLLRKTTLSICPQGCLDINCLCTMPATLAFPPIIISAKLKKICKNRLLMFNIDSTMTFLIRIVFSMLHCTISI